MKYKGSCHCGRVSFEAEGEIKGAMACNCSMCQRKGSLLWFVPRGDFRLVSPEAAAGTYTFHKHVDSEIAALYSYLHSMPEAVHN